MYWMLKLQVLTASSALGNGAIEKSVKPKSQDFTIHSGYHHEGSAWQPTMQSVLSFGEENE